MSHPSNGADSLHTGSSRSPEVVDRVMTQEPIDHYGANYEQFAAQVYAQVRTEAFGQDIGQTSWLTADEQDIFLSWLRLQPTSRLLDVACGSGGPTIRAAKICGSTVHGIDIHEAAVRTARGQAAEANLTDTATFQQADASQPLPFADTSFDAIICIDAINHFPDRRAILDEWARLLAPDGRIVFTDPIVVTGALSSEEIAIRSSIGFFLFTPPAYDEDLLAAAGFEVVEKQDRTDNMARMARSRRDARQRHASDLRRIEGDQTFDGQQRFFDVAARLAEERRLSRFAFCARRL